MVKDTGQVSPTGRQIYATELRVIYQKAEALYFIQTAVKTPKFISSSFIYLKGSRRSLSQGFVADNQPRNLGR